MLDWEEVGVVADGFIEFGRKCLNDVLIGVLVATKDVVHEGSEDSPVVDDVFVDLAKRVGNVSLRRKLVEQLVCVVAGVVEEWDLSRLGLVQQALRSDVSLEWWS